MTPLGTTPVSTYRHTRALLWEEYRAAHPLGFSYAWYCQHFEAWKGRVRPTMRQAHVGGDKIFVDFAGDMIEVIDPQTGEAKAMKLFVAAMGASNYTYAEAVTPKASRTGSARMSGCWSSSAGSRRP